MTAPRASDAERELNDLRARAYGPKPDIEADPAAIARLIELETAHVGAETPVNATESVGSRAADGAPTVPLARESVAVGPAAAEAVPMVQTTSRESFGRSRWQRATATRSRVWFIVGSIVVVAILIHAATWLFATHPDATLELTAGEADMFIETLIAQDEDPDISTLRQFERYHDIDVWSVQVSSVENGRGTCLIALDRVGGRYQYECLPLGLELAVHMSVVAEMSDGFGEWLPDDSIISLHLRENTVDVFVHSPPAT